MDLLKGFTANYYINVAITAWFLAQLSKTLLTLILKKKFVMDRMIGAGGMPSSHTALVCSLTIAMARKTGVSSAEFALALALACIVMYDAHGDTPALRGNTQRCSINWFLDFSWSLKNRIIQRMTKLQKSWAIRR